VAVYFVSFAVSYGFANFLFLCNLSVILTAIGLWTGSRVLLSSQAVAILLVGTVWTADLVSRLVTGRHFLGGTEYMWDPRWPLFTRLLSLYHVVLPPLLVFALRRVGYDRRGYWLQCAIAVAGVSLGRLFGPEANINQAFADPFFRRGWGGPLTHVAVVSGFLVLIGYPISERVLLELIRLRAPGALVRGAG
jgi:hypothetical protein